MSQLSFMSASSTSFCALAALPLPSEFEALATRCSSSSQVGLSVIDLLPSTVYFLPSLPVTVIETPSACPFLNRASRVSTVVRYESIFASSASGSSLVSSAAALASFTVPSNAAMYPVM